MYRVKTTTVQKPYAPSCTFTLLFDTCPFFFLKYDRKRPESKFIPVLLLFFQVNKVDFGHFTREEAANFLLELRTGERVEISTQHKMDSK